MFTSEHFLPKRVLIFASVLVVALAGFNPSVSAQLNSNTATVALNATLAETLSISASPSIVNFTLVPGSTAAGSAPVVITTQWVLTAVRSTVAMYAWFATPSAALSDGAALPNVIPSSQLFASTPNGLPTTLTAFIQSNTLGAAGGGLKLFTQTLSSVTREASRTDNVALMIDLSSQPQLPAGSYVGTLNLQAQVL